MNTRSRNAFTLIEILIVVVIMAVLAATIIPQFTDSTEDAKASTALFNLNTLRSQVEIYKAQHGGALPDATFSKLLGRTDSSGTLSADGAYGPYLSVIPENPVTGSNTITTINKVAPDAGDVSASGGGWLFSTMTGGVWLDHPDFFEK